MFISINWDIWILLNYDEVIENVIVGIVRRSINNFVFLVYMEMLILFMKVK